MLLDRLEACTISVGYGDFLAESAKYNAPLFDRWLIVTTPDDEETREVCRRFSLPTLLTEDYRLHGDFSKGRMIERGLQHLAADAWRVHLDADLVLPARTRQMLEASQLQTDKVYGVDRVMCRSYEQWRQLQAAGYLQYGQHDFHNRLRWPAGLEVGARWVDFTFGYVPIGFFQLWHSRADLWRGARIRPYPTIHNDSCRTDVQFSLQFDRHKRELLPEIVAVHLESQKAPLGANWKGRKTRRFGPPFVLPEGQRSTS